MSIPFQKIDLSKKGRQEKFIWLSLTMLSCVLLIGIVTSLKIHIFITAITLSALILTWLTISILTIETEGNDSRFAKWLGIEVFFLLIATILLNQFFFKDLSVLGWGAYVLSLIFKIIPNIVFKRK